MPKPRKCRVRGCESINNDVRFFSFPHDPVELEKWRDNLRYTEWDFLPTTNAYVCIRHFEKSAVGGKCLKKGAIPTLNLGYDEPPPHSLHIPKFGRFCCIENCIGDEKRTLFTFPTKNYSWIKACNIDVSKYKRLYICELHFDKKFVSKNRLLHGAFPSLNLPPQSTRISAENMSKTETLKCNESKDNRRTCCIKGCGGDENGTLISFPNVEEARMRWITACKLNPSECGELYICARHFNTTFLANDNKIQKIGAFPSLNLYSQPAGSASGRAIACLPTLQNRACPPNATRVPLEFEQHYFLESKRKRHDSHDTDETSKAISFVSENEGLIYSIQKVEKSSDAASSECNYEQINDTNDTDNHMDISVSDHNYASNKINNSIILDHASFSNNSIALDVPNVQTSKEKFHKCNHEHFEKRLVELESEPEKTHKCGHEDFEKRITELKAEIESLKSKYHHLAGRAILPFACASEEAITFAKMIVDNPKRWYSEKEKFMAQNLCYISPKAYDFMREELKFILPHRSVLLRWRPPTKSTISGIDDNASKTLKNIVSQMSESERICQIMFDETDVKKYDAPSSTKSFASKANIRFKCCFFMVKGIFSDWKYILSYYIENTGFNAYSLLRYLNQNLDFAESIGLKVKAIVCNQSLYNAHMYKLLYVTANKPFILHKEEIIHCFFDYFYLIKSVRDSFLNYDIRTIDGVVRLKVIKTLYAINNANANLGLFPKLTPSHLCPGKGERMNVSLATQLLSRSVSVGIEMAINQNLLGSDPNTLKCAKATQKFIKRMNDLFGEFDNRDQSKTVDCTERINILNDHLKFLYSLEQLNTISMRFIPGLILTTKSMTNFYKDVFKEHTNLSINLLGKFNQDALNTFLYELRRSNDINTHPTENEIQVFVTTSRTEFEQKYKKCKDEPIDSLKQEIVITEEPWDNSSMSEEQFKEFIEVAREDCPGAYFIQKNDSIEHASDSFEDKHGHNE